VKRGSFVITVVFLVLASGSLTSFDETAISRNLESADGPLDESLEIDPVDTDYYPSQDELQGILNPVVIEQRGNKTTSSLHAETDSKTNVMANLTIDVANDWVGSKASVNLWDLNRLYVENGSVSEGIEGATKDPVGSVLFYPYGWDAVSGSPDSNMEMLAEYSNQELGVAANGYSSGDDYFHVNGSYVYWTQTVNNTPYLESFIFNVDFLYDRGPLANSNVTLHALVDDTLIWNTTAETLLDSTWYNSGNVLVDLTDIGSQFEFKIGLYFDGNVSHTKKYIRFCIDNMKLVGEISPTFDDANIHFNIGGESVVIAGTSTGLASIINSSLWKSENVLIEFTSDLSYSFDYTGTMLSSHYLNSTQSPNQSDGGVHFSSQLNGGSMLTLYTFLGVLPDIDDFTLIISHPVDWENITVYNPFGTIVTSSCIIDSGTITIPNAILYTLGWWEIRLESPNYVRSIQTLKLNEPTLTWFPATVFRSTNITKPFIEIGESVPIPNAPQNVNISWFMPNGTEWFSESISGGSNGIINGSQLEFGPLNTTAGIWQVQVSWTNGTELAFGNVIFEIHHGASLAPHESVIHAEGGLSVSNFVYYQDSENNEFLMDPVASVTANWSVTTVNFIPDSIHNWWVGTFDTSLIGPGNHLVVVNVSRPFFDDVSCEFFLTISFTDNDITIDNPTAEIGLGDTHLATFSYLDAYEAGISGANVSIDFTGPTDGIIWAELIDIGGGDYSIEFSAVHSGSYAITISASKDYYEESQGALFIFVGEISTSLTLENGTAAIIRYGEQFRLVVQYTNSSGFGLDTASVSVESTTPETGLNYTTATYEGNGYFSIILTPTETATYTLLINASLTDHRTQFVSFTLTATTIQSHLIADVSIEVISVDQYSIVTLNFSSEIYGGLDNATISPLNPPADLFFSTVTPLGGGLYSIEVTSSLPGSYQIVFNAHAINHNNATTAFILTVINIPTQSRVASGAASASIEFSQLFEILVFYERIDETPANISLALLQVEFTSIETLNWTVEPYGEGYILRIAADELGRWELTITAQKALHQTGVIQFVLFVTENPTLLDVPVIPPSVYIDDISSYVFTYRIEGGAGVVDADVSFSGIDPDWVSFTPIGDGNYNITFKANQTGTFSFDVIFAKYGYQMINQPVILSVTLIDTDLYTASGSSSASVVFGTVYEIEMYYENTLECLNVSSASIQVEFTSIETLNWTAEPYGDGYILRIEADELGRWELTITAQKANHQTGFVQFVLFVTENPTFLDVPVILSSVYIGNISSYVFAYSIEGGAGVIDADVSFSGIDPDWVSFTPIGDGNYSITIEANQTGTFSFNVIFAKYGYQMINQPVILSVTLIDTDLYTASGSSSASVVFGTVYEIEMYYENTLECLNVSSASIQVEFTSIETLNWTAEPYGDGYILRIEADELGRWELTITAQKANHQTGFVQFVLFVTENPTFLDVPVILSSVYIGNISSYVFAYSIEGGAGVIDADVSFSGIDPDWVSFTPIGDGNYSITIEANQTGTFSFNVIFAKYGYQMVNQPVAFQVNRIPLTIEMAAPTWMVTSDLTFSLALLDVTGTPVSDAFVNYTITQGGVDLHIGVMTEDPDSKGTYIATISQTRVPWTGNQLYSIKISVSKENHQVLNQGYQVNVYEYMPPGYEVQVFVQTVVPQAAFVIVALVSLVIGRRMYRANRRKKAIAILAVKRRFEDIRGILGIIVIHKASGLAVYSKILKGGFDEALMSAFITAITHFRTEFEVEAPHWEFGVVPISDIISIVPTRNLLCAFIVGVKPTMTLEDRMVRYARAVGEMFDETMAAPPREVIDDAVYGLLDSLFDDVMDGALLRQYRVKKDAPYPRNQKCLQTYIETYPPEDGFGLDSLADGMSMCGIQEGNIYQQIIDAIENGILESIDPQMENNGPLEGDDESFESEPADL